MLDLPSSLLSLSLFYSAVLHDCPPHGANTLPNCWISTTPPPFNAGMHLQALVYSAYTNFFGAITHFYGLLPSHLATTLKLTPMV